MMGENQVIFVESLDLVALSWLILRRPDYRPARFLDASTATGAVLRLLAGLPPISPLLPAPIG